MKAAAILIAILTLFGISMLSFPKTVDASSTAVFGSTVRGGYTDYISNYKDATRFQLTEQGTLQSISIYFESFGFDAKVAIYSDSSGMPNSLVAQSGSEYVSATGWQIFPIPQTALSAVYYWFSIVSDGVDAQVSISYSGLSMQHCVGVSFGYNYEFAGSFGSVMWYGAAAVSMYATYVPAARSAPAPTPVQTSTPTPTPTPAPTRTPSPTSTSTPFMTPTATPSSTRTPAATPTPAPIVVSTPTSGATFGNTARGGYADYISNYKDGTRFQLSEQGTLQSLTVYFESSGFDAKVAVYRDSSGSPADLVAQSANEYISTTGWRTFSTRQVTLSAGYYWLAIVSDGADAQVSISYSGLPLQHCVGVSSSYNNEFTGSFGSVMWFGAASVSMYATYDPITPSLSVPTPVQTATLTPAPISTPAPVPTSTATSQGALGIYSDQTCTRQLANIAWGTLTPGGTTTLTLWTKNQGDTPITLTKAMTNVNPTNAVNYLTLNWDYAGQTIPQSGILKLTLSLVVSPNVQAISSFSFDTVITATG